MVGSTELKQHWRAVYAGKDEDEVSWYQARPSLSLQLIRAAVAAPDAAIIDAGGGASTLVDHLLQAGYRDISVLDIAPEGMDKAKARLGAEQAAQVRWIVADLLQWQPPQMYDLWHDRAVFHFLTEEEQRQRYVDVLRRATRPGGHVIIATFAPDGPEMCSGLPVRRQSPQEIAAALGEEFDLLQTADEHHTTPAGKVQHFNYALLRRRQG